MSDDILDSRLIEGQKAEALIWNDRVYTYQDLYAGSLEWFKRLREEVSTGDVVMLEGDYSANTLQIFIALVRLKCIVVPLASTASSLRDKYVSLAGVSFLIQVDQEDEVKMQSLQPSNTSSLVDVLKERQHSGLIIFSSGSTGEPKGVVHDIDPLIAQHVKKRRKLRTVIFYLFDHIAGIDTFFFTLMNGGCLISLKSRDPQEVLRNIEKFKAELLPASPTFLNLMFFSEAYRNFNLDSLQTISYGTEVMPEALLQKLIVLFPQISFKQTYGMSELGAIPSSSKPGAPQWFRLGNENTQVRVREGKLQIKSPAAMLGYLNGEKPFDSEGWMHTGDMVEEEGEYLRILGRDSEIINVGGEKVFPAQVENVLREMSGVIEVKVKGVSNPITGKMVKATFQLEGKMDRQELRKRVLIHCSGKLQPFQIPQKITISKSLLSSRLKKA